MAPATAPWYRHGLSFGCTRCGGCCTGEGHVWVDVDQMRAIADHLELELEAFTRLYVRRVGRRLSLTEKVNHDCIFWDGEETGCRVYPVRPTQCRTFPFWPENLGTPASWKQAGRDCPGVGSGKLYRLGEIRTLASSAGETGPAAAGELEEPTEL